MTRLDVKNVLNYAPPASKQRRSIRVVHLTLAIIGMLICLAALFIILIGAFAGFIDGVKVYGPRAIAVTMFVGLLAGIASIVLWQLVSRPAVPSTEEEQGKS